MSTIIIGSVVFVGVYIIAAYVISDQATRDVVDVKLKTEYRNMAIGLSFFGVFLMWLMWVSVYMHQLNPIIQPILDKEIVEINNGH